MDNFGAFPKVTGLLFAIVLIASTSYVSGEGDAKNNNAKILEMYHFAKPKTVEEMIFQIKRVNILFPEHLSGEQLGEDGVVGRTAIVLSNLVDVLASDKEFRTRETVSELVKLLMKFNKAIKAVIIPHFAHRFPADMNVTSPPGSGIINGGDPAEIKDPILQNQYLAMIDENDRNIAINNLQDKLYRHMDSLELPTVHLLKVFRENSSVVDVHMLEELAGSIVATPR